MHEAWAEFISRWSDDWNVDGAAMAQSIGMVGRPISIAGAIDPGNDDLTFEVTITYVVSLKDFDFILKTHSEK